MNQLSEYYNKNRKQIVEDYLTFLRFPSISSEKEYEKDVAACAEWLKNYLLKIGFQVGMWASEGHPTLFATYLKAGKDKPTLLIYNHYDVQPVDPLDKWHSPPFEPTIKGDQVYARGAMDDKGQCFYTIQALKALIEQTGTLPINVKLCIEGEEEMGSHSLTKLIPVKKEQLKADYIAIVDLGLRKADIPAVTLGVRGIVTLDVEIEDSNIDLHSGSHGGIVYNPIHALVEVLSKLRDANGKIDVPGFYDDVQDLAESEKKGISFEFSDEEYFADYGTKPLGGEKGFSPAERMAIRPTIEINGINGGYSGTGFKTVIPSKATAKISCRLVPNQEPIKIGELVAKFIRNHIPEGLKSKVEVRPGFGAPVRASPSSRVVQAFAKAFSDVFGKPCEYIFEGGSIPIIPELANAANGEVVLVGLGLGTDNIHAPNEHFGLDRLEKGFLVMGKAIQELSVK